MQTNNTSEAVLRALFELARDDRRAHIANVARMLGVSAREVDAALMRLEATNLVDATRVRLTFPGLTVAVGLPPLAQQRKNRQRASRQHTAQQRQGERAA